MAVAGMQISCCSKAHTLLSRVEGFKAQFNLKQCYNLETKPRMHNWKWWSGSMMIILAAELSHHHVTHTRCMPCQLGGMNRGKTNPSFRQHNLKRKESTATLLVYRMYDHHTYVV